MNLDEDRHSSIVAPVRGIKVIDAGIMEYGLAWSLQQRLHARCVAGNGDAFLMLVEHPPVITMGKNSNEKFLLAGEAWLSKVGVSIYRSDRGGEATAHNPGQLVVYPVIPLASFGLGARAYIHKLEATVISTLATFGVSSHRDPDHPGVWVGNNKICAVGTRIKDRATMHGIALNVENDLGIFGLIVPCGIAGRSVINLAQVLGISPSMDRVKSEFINTFATLFECQVSSASVDEF